MMKHQQLIQFGTNIRSLRETKNISQEKLAELAGMHRTYLGGIERGERNLSLLNMLKLSKALDVPLTELVKGL